MHYLVLLCTTSSGRIIRVLSEQKMFLDRKKSKLHSFVLQNNPKVTSPVSILKEKSLVKTFVSVVEIDMLPNCQSVDKMSQSLLASQDADVARFACLLAKGSCQGREDSWRTGFGTWQPTGGSFPSERRTLPRVRAAAGQRVLCCVQLMPHSRY